MNLILEKIRIPDSGPIPSYSVQHENSHGRRPDRRHFPLPQSHPWRPLPPHGPPLDTKMPPSLPSIHQIADEGGIWAPRARAFLVRFFRLPFSRTHKTHSSPFAQVCAAKINARLTPAIAFSSKAPSPCRMTSVIVDGHLSWRATSAGDDARSSATRSQNEQPLVSQKIDSRHFYSSSRESCYIVEARRPF